MSFRTWWFLVRSGKKASDGSNRQTPSIVVWCEWMQYVFPNTCISCDERFVNFDDVQFARMISPGKPGNIQGTDSGVGRWSHSLCCGGTLFRMRRFRAMSDLRILRCAVRTNGFRRVNPATNREPLAGLNDGFRLCCWECVLHCDKKRRQTVRDRQTPFHFFNACYLSNTTPPRFSKTPSSGL